MSSTTSSMRITLNGETRTVSEGTSVASLLEQLGLDRRKVAVERNEAIVPRSTYGQSVIAEGDRFEIVHFIGGG